MKLGANISSRVAQRRGDNRVQGGAGLDFRHGKQSSLSYRVNTSYPRGCVMVRSLIRRRSETVGAAERTIHQLVR